MKELITDTNLKSMTKLRNEIEEKITHVRWQNDSNIGTMGDLCMGIVDYLIQKGGGESSPVLTARQLHGCQRRDHVFSRRGMCFNVHWFLLSS